MVFVLFCFLIAVERKFARNAGVTSENARNETCFRKAPAAVDLFDSEDFPADLLRSLCRVTYRMVVFFLVDDPIYYEQGLKYT